MRKKQNVSLVKIVMIIQIVLVLLPNAFALAKSIEDEKTLNIQYGECKKYEIQCFDEETKHWEHINSSIKYYITENGEKQIVYCIGKNSSKMENDVENNVNVNVLNLENSNITKENLIVNQIENQIQIKENVQANNVLVTNNEILTEDKEAVNKMLEKENEIINKMQAAENVIRQLEVEENNIINANTIENNLIEENKISINKTINENILENEVEYQYLIGSKEQVSDDRIKKILENTYPKISLEELEIENIEDAYMVTEQAITYVFKDRKLEDFSTYYKIETETCENENLEEENEIKETKKEEILLKAIENLIDIAYNGKQTNNEEEILEKEENNEIKVDEKVEEPIQEEEKEEEEKIIEEAKKEEEEVEVQENENIEITVKTEEEYIKEELPIEDEKQIQVEGKIEKPEVYIKQESKDTVGASEEINYEFEIKNIGNTALTNFTWYSILPTNYATATKITTGEYNQDVNYNIYYKTNKNTEYVVLKQNINSKENEEIDLTNLNLKEGEIIEEIKVCFDEVDIEFFAVAKPSICMKINKNVEDSTQIKSYAILDGYNQDYKVTSEDYIQSTVYNVEKKNKLPRTGF